MAAAHPPSARQPPCAARRLRPRNALGRTACRPREADWEGSVRSAEWAMTGTSSDTSWHRQPTDCVNHQTARTAGDLSEAVRGIAGSFAAGMTRRDILAALLTCGDGDALRDVIARLAAVR